jgi:SSS family solute:Na+ symporter
MSWIDWTVLLVTLLSIAAYGIWKSRGSKNIEAYLLANKSMPWHTVAFSIMATQASAITFLSAPGLAYESGLSFVQFYFGLPIAMIVLCIFIVPIYHKLNVYTAYEYLESRFDIRVRSLAALLFLIQRGLAAGITIYAPAIILSTLLGWNIYLTNLVIGLIVIVYTVSGGTKAVSYTQLAQMAVILSGMFIAGFMVVKLMPDGFGFGDAVLVAGKLGKMNAIDYDFDINNRYNIWSGLIGGFFLALSYFGTDQSQVARYLSAKSTVQSRLGLLFNGIIKIPMQFSILFIGSLLFVFYQFYTPPVFFNKNETARLAQSDYADEFKTIEDKHHYLYEGRKEQILALGKAIKAEDEIQINGIVNDLNLKLDEEKQLRTDLKELMSTNSKLADTNDTNYIFLDFVINFLPIGLIGLLIAVILAAAMSSTSSELNALASTTIVDIYKRSIKKDGSETHYLKASRWGTLIWGFYAILVSIIANQLGSLIEAVNILGSLFYGTILGIFLTAFFLKKVNSQAVLVGAAIAQALVVYMFFWTDIGYLWFNVIGCLVVMGSAYIMEAVIPKVDKQS